MPIRHANRNNNYTSNDILNIDYSYHKVGLNKFFSRKYNTSNESVFSLPLDLRMLEVRDTFKIFSASVMLLNFSRFTSIA